MLVKQFLIGGDRNFAYLVADEDSGKAAVIDPAYAPEVPDQYAAEQGLKIEFLLNTHSHFDHTNGNDYYEEKYGLTPVSWGEKHPESGKPVADNETFPLGNLEFRIIYTPGHTNDSICFLIKDALFTGDTLFVGKVGGTDFGKNAEKEYHSLHDKLMILDEKTRVFPGHNFGTQPESTIGHEKKTNPFLLQPDFGSFVHLKKHWAEYKQEHGIA